MTKLKIWPLFCLCFVLTGCWDSVEINQKSVILDFVIDKNEAEDAPDERYSITYTIPDMAKLSGTNSLAEDTVANVVVKAPTIEDSIGTLETQTQKTVTFSHVKGILVGKSLLADKQLFEEMVTGMTRDMLIARNTPFVAVDGKAEDVATTQNPQNPILGLYLLNYFNNKERPISEFTPQILGNFIRDMEETGIATMPILKMDEEGAITISGNAVIQDYKLVDFIDKEAVKGQLLIQGKAENAPVVAKDGSYYLTYNINRQKSKIEFREEDGQLSCNITLEVRGEIRDYTSDQSKKIFDLEKIKDVQKIIEGKLVQEAEYGIRKAQELGVDYLGIGDKMYRNHYKMWQKYRANWHNQTFKALPITVQAKVDITSTGILE